LTVAKPTLDELLAALLAVPIAMPPPPNDNDAAHSSSFGGAIWDPGRIEAIRCFLTSNKLERGYRIEFTRDEALYVVECLEELRARRAVIFNARRDAHRASEEQPVAPVAASTAAPIDTPADAPRTHTEAQLDEFESLLTAVEQRRRARIDDASRRYFEAAQQKRSAP